MLGHEDSMGGLLGGGRPWGWGEVGAVTGANLRGVCLSQNGLQLRRLRPCDRAAA